MTIAKKKNLKSLTLQSPEVKSTIEDALVIAGEHLSKPLLIKNGKQLLDAEADLAIIKTKSKEIKDMKESITKPLEAAKKATIAHFKEPLDKLAEAESQIKSFIIKYNNALIEKNRKIEEERKAKALAEAEEQGKTETFVIPVYNLPTAIDKLESTTVRDLWSFQIDDINLIPREYMVVDQVKLNAIARTMKENTNIPGGKAVKTQSLNVRV